MKKTTNKKTKLMASIAIVLLMITVFSLMLSALVQAQDEYENMQEGGSVPLPSGVTPDLTLDTLSFLSFRPNPVGVDQTILVNMMMVPPLHVSRYISDYKVTIQKPDGSEVEVVMDSYRADATAWFEYLVDQTGTWKLKFDNPGGYFPPGNYTIHMGAYFSQQSDTIVSFPESVYYEPSSTGWQELEVQEDMVFSWPPADLPTDYWTRPVDPQNREWAPILGWYPWTGRGGGPNWPADTNIYANADYDFTPYVQGPESAHVVWRRRLEQSGMIGGDYGTISFYGPSFGGGPSIIYEGRCYQSITKAVDEGPVSVWQCYDLRTGEIYWEYPSARTPNAVHFETGHAEVPGGDPVFGLTDYLVAISGGRLYKWDPWDGSLDVNVTAMSGTIYSDPYVLSVQNLGGGNYRLINWTLDGSTDNFAERVVGNITWPWSNLGSSQDFEAGIAASVSGISHPATGVTIATRVRAASLKTGAELWDHTIDQWMYSGSCVVADQGKVAVLMMGGYFKAWDLQTGNLAWDGEAMDYPWGKTCFGTYGIHSAYGMFYRTAYDGVYAFDWDTGNIVWRYKAPSVPFETPYDGYYSFMGTATIADEKLYVANSEHTPTQPVTRGWKVHCINALTGEGIWNITSSAGYGAPGAVADGYLTSINAYDGYMYVFGKGKSTTTVSTPDIGVPKVTVFTIKGTVLDQSPAQPGTPCVSKASMTTQMEYLHMQYPIDGIWHNETITGVPVKLTAIASDGSVTDIGTTTTDGYSGAFGHAWTPTEEGTYKIVASFEGDDSYGSSLSTTFVTVGPAPSGGQPQETEEPTTEAPTTEAPTTEAPTTEAPTTEAPTSEVPTTEQPSGEAPAFPTTEVAIIAAIAVAIVIGVGAYWALRRRK
jgi:hypothetical protein